MRDGWPSEFVGLPYLLFGRTRAGVDCYGLIVLVYHDVLGIEIAPFAEVAESTLPLDVYREFWETHRELAWERVDEDHVEAGDVVDLSVLGHPHCGIVTRPGQMIHARAGVGVRLAEYSRGFFCRRVLGTYRHRER